MEHFVYDGIILIYLNRNISKTRNKLQVHVLYVACDSAGGNRLKAFEICLTSSKMGNK